MFACVLSLEQGYKVSKTHYSDYAKYPRIKCYFDVQKYFGLNLCCISNKVHAIRMKFRSTLPSLRSY
jgi:hypothetical protein